MNLIEHFVDGKVFKGTSKRTGKIFNSATGEKSSEVKFATTDDVNKTVLVAKKAFINWSQKTPLFRSDLFANITSDFCSPVAGLKTFPFLSEDPETSSPPTKC